MSKEPSLAMVEKDQRQRARARLVTEMAEGRAFRQISTNTPMEPKLIYILSLDFNHNMW